MTSGTKAIITKDGYLVSGKTASTGAYQIESSGDIRSDTAFNCNGTAGVTQVAGHPTSITTAGGIVTAITVGGGNIITAVTPVTNTYLVLTSDSTVVCNRATAFAVTLPPAVTAIIGLSFTIKNIGVGSVTVTADATGTADLIDGAATKVLATWAAVTVQCSAADTWIII